MRQCNTSPLERSGFSIIFAKTDLWKNFEHRNFRPVKYDFANAAKQRQTFPTSALVEYERQKYETQRAIGNAENQLFFWQKLAGKIFMAKNITTRSPVYFNGMYNKIKNLWKSYGNLFLDKFRHCILEKNSFRVETCIKTHCCTNSVICFSIQVIRITLRNVGRVELKILQKFTRKISWENHKTFGEKLNATNTS